MAVLAFQDDTDVVHNSLKDLIKSSRDEVRDIVAPLLVPFFAHPHGMNFYSRETRCRGWGRGSDMIKVNV